MSTGFDQQGFPTVVTLPPGYATASKSYDSQGFLITSGPAAPAASSSSVAGTAAATNAVGQKSSDQSGIVNSDAGATAGAAACTKEVGASLSLLLSLVLGALML